MGVKGVDAQTPGHSTQPKEAPMSTYRKQLPQTTDKTFITDGGLETTLIFRYGYDLPAFAAFDILRHEEGSQVLWDYYNDYIRLAHDHHLGFILESPTWRASRDWGAQIGYDRQALETVNHRAIDLLADIRQRYETDATPMVISGCIGPRSDGYAVGKKMTPSEAEAYHREQIGTLSRTHADMVAAFTINYSEEAIGITRAAQSVRIPVAIGLTVETDGRLPSGQPLGEAIKEVDQATGSGPAYYMINCAHPSHFEPVLTADDPWGRRIRAIRANASAKSHAELDDADTLDAGDPADLGRRFARLQTLLPHLNILGGCCGTDHRHVAAICRSITLH
jgi:S-methylmethionine-dependent homocysteine/selenocysteine methylase